MRRVVPLLFVVMVAALTLDGFAGSTSAHPVRGHKASRAATHKKGTVKADPTRALAVKIARLQQQVGFERRATWSWQRAAHITPTKVAHLRCEKSPGLSYLKWCYRLWFDRHHRWQKYVQSTPHDTGYLSPPQARELGRRMAAYFYRWTGGQWICLDTIWGTRRGTLESGWSVTAANPKSQAYGIPQSNPGSKMASAGRNWLHSAFVQIKWGLKYIRDRYQTPCGALAVRLAQGSY